MTDTPSEESAAPTEPVVEASETPPESTKPPRAWDHVAIWLAVSYLVIVGLLTFFNIDRVWNLPAHVLLVHVPLVLIPIVAVAAVFVAWWPRWRERYGLALSIVSLVVLASTILSAGAGEKLRDHLFPRSARAGIQRAGESSIVRQHVHAASVLKFSMMIFVLIIVVMYIVTRFRARAVAAGKDSFITGEPSHVFFGVCVTIFAVIVFGYVIDAGHLGSKAAWEDRGGVQRAGANGDRQLPGFGQFPGNDGPNQFGRQGGGREFPGGGPTNRTVPRRQGSATSTTSTPPTTVAPAST